MGSHFGALLRADALASFVAQLSNQASNPWTEDHGEAGDRDDDGQPDLAGGGQRVVGREEHAETRKHEHGTDPEAQRGLPAPDECLERTPRRLCEPGALVVVGTRPQHGHPEAGQGERPHGDVAEPHAGVAQQEDHAGDDQTDGQRLAQIASLQIEILEPAHVQVALAVGTGHQPPQPEVELDADTSGDGEDDEADPDDDRIDAERIRDTGRDTGDDAIRAALHRADAETAAAHEDR